MKEVSLYTITENRVLATSLEGVTTQNIQRLTNPGSCWTFFDKAEIERLEIPIHHVKDYGQDRFIAIHPHLARILEAPVRAEMEHLLYCRRLGKQAFDALPWWKRAWLAIRKVHPNVN